MMPALLQDLSHGVVNHLSRNWLCPGAVGCMLDVACANAEFFTVREGGALCRNVTESHVAVVDVW